MLFRVFWRCAGLRFFLFSVIMKIRTLLYGHDEKQRIEGWEKQSMKKAKNILWGIVLVAVGVLLGLKALDLIDFNIFFDGWWTLFILVPCGIGLFTQRDKTGNVIGILIGGCLLLACQGILSFAMLWKLLVPAVIVIIGLKMIFGGIFRNHVTDAVNKLDDESKPLPTGCATFSGCRMSFDHEVFEGAELTAVFGGVKCDLRNAVIEKDCVIKVSAIFGGIDLLVPDTVNVKTASTSLFGGISNKAAAKNQAHTIYVSGTCMFGGVDIK